MNVARGKVLQPPVALLGHGLTLPGIVSETAWAPPSDLRFEEWEQVGVTLGRIGRARRWWIGDWVNHGERAYGEKYTLAIDATGYEYQTVANCAYVAKAIEPSRRREGLSWSHHAEVAALEPADQEAWLDRAQAEGLTRNELRKAIKATSELPAEGTDLSDLLGEPLGGIEARDTRDEDEPLSFSAAMDSVVKSELREPQAVRSLTRVFDDVVKASLDTQVVRLIATSRHVEVLMREGAGFDGLTAKEARAMDRDLARVERSVHKIRERLQTRLRVAAVN
jgi:hypothetical protein